MQVKVIKSYLESFLIICATFWSCTEDVVTGIDPSKVAPADVTYDENNSTSTTLGFYWEVDDALAAGAVSFTAQIIRSEELGGNAYTGRDSQTLQASSVPNDGAIFNGLTENSKYYARVRANYPRSIYSEWVYVRGKDGKPAVIKLGKGIVEESIEVITGATARIVEVSPSTAVVEWSVTDFTDLEVDSAADCSITLYNDADCSDLFVSWDLSDETIYKGFQPRFVFSGLNPSTDYWFVAQMKVSDADNELVLESSPLKITTSELKAVPVKGYVSVGQTVLYQDFSELIWGGDQANKAVGYSAENRSTVSKLKVARGWNPVGDSEYGFYLCKYDTEMGLYNSIGKALKGSGTTLAEWAELREDNAVPGMICGRPGSVKIGASQKVGWIVTPQLSSLTETATVEVSFRAAPYGTSIETLDPVASCIRLLDGAVVSSNIVQSASVNNIVQSFDLMNDLSLQEYKFTIYNVTPSSRIAIGPKRANGETGQHRMLLDDICIRVVSYGQTDIQVETPVVALVAGEGLVMASWQSCDNAGSYDVEYRRKGDPGWTAAGTTTMTSLTVRGLLQRTEYEFRVKAKYSDTQTSQWSEVMSVTTPAVTSEVRVTCAWTTESQIGFRWNTVLNASEDVMIPYLVELYRDAACSDLVVRLALGEYGVPDVDAMTVTAAVKANASTMPQIWTASSGACFMFTGLESDRDYTLRVTNRNLQVSGICTAHTDASSLVRVPSGKAAAGEVILQEDFSELVWGGSPSVSRYASGMPGINSERRNTLGRFENIRGTDPLASDAARLWLCTRGKDYGLLNTTWRAVANTRLKDWAAISENYSGSAAGSLCGMAGVVKLGAASSWAQIVTPAFDCLSGNAKIEVSFDMCPYTGDGQKASDPLDAVVKVLENVITGINGDMHQGVLSCDEVQVKSFMLDSGIPDMKRYTFTFDNVKPGSCIAVGTCRPAGAAQGQRRAFLDNIRIKVLNYK